MNNTPNNIEEILERQICGFHQYAFSPTPHLTYVSRNLCEMLGVEADDLLGGHEDLYAQWVHPADRERYFELINKVMLGEKPCCGEYRLMKKDGTSICVRDTVTPKRQDDGAFVGYSVLTDITDLKNESTDLQFFSEMIPCGFLRYTCEKQPKITYMNSKMIEILRLPKAKDGEIDYLEMYKSNIFMMIPMEERRRFAKYLNRVYSANAPIAGDMTLFRCDGTRAHIFGWVTKYINKQGVAEFQSVCMDVTDQYRARKADDERRYFQALTDVYDKIFEFDLDANTVKCLHCGSDSSFKRFESIAMQIDDALEKWLIAAVSVERQDEIRSFFRRFCQKELHGVEGRPPQISYNARSADGRVKQYTGVFIKLDEAVSFYCCREVKEVGSDIELKIENSQLRQKMRDLVMQFSDGIAAFEVSADGRVKPLYASENVCEFFGYTKEEWLPLTEQFTPLESFVAYSETTYEDILTLLSVGEAEFSYFDYASETERRIKAICSDKDPNSNSSRYIMLYAIETEGQSERQSLKETRPVSIRTFGYFDVFVGDNPIAFRNKKSKELFALLVDRKGGFVSSEEAISFLWEDEPANSLTLSRYRKVALRLKNTLEEYGISDIIESVDGKRRIVMEKVDCDLYRYLSGREDCAQLFKGSYLTNYSWGEMTLGELLADQRQNADAYKL